MKVFLATFRLTPSMPMPPRLRGPSPYPIHPSAWGWVLSLWGAAVRCYKLASDLEVLEARTLSGILAHLSGPCPQIVRNYEEEVFSESPVSLSASGQRPKIRAHHDRRASLSSSSSRSARSRSRSSCSRSVDSVISVSSSRPSRRPSSLWRVSTLSLVSLSVTEPSRALSEALGGRSGIASVTEVAATLHLPDIGSRVPSSSPRSSRLRTVRSVTRRTFETSWTV